MCTKNLRFFFRGVGSFLFIIFFLLQTAEAMMRFMPKEQLVATSEYVVIAKMQDISNTGKTAQWGDVKATIIKNELKVIESIKGIWSWEKPLVLYTLKFDEQKQDNVELPRKDSQVLLFLKKDKDGKLIPVNNLQGVMKKVWGEHQDKKGRVKPFYSYFPIQGGGRHIKLDSLRELVQKQDHSCKSKVLLGFWSFGRIFHYIKDEQEFLCNLTLTDEFVDKKGYKIKSCNSDASYWRLDGETLLFKDTIGATTIKFNKIEPDYWKSNYIGRFTYCLKRLDNGANNAK